VKTELRKILERHEGRDCAITGIELAKRLNQRDDRKIRLIILELIEDGFPVASTTKQPAGFFIPVSYQEAREYEATLKSRLIADARRKKYFRRAADCHLRPATQGVFDLQGVTDG